MAASGIATLAMLALAPAPLSPAWSCASPGACRTGAVRMSAAGKRSGIDARLADAAERGAAVLVDVENVRGKSGFELTHEQLLERATMWTEQRGLRGHVSLIVDHGTVRRRKGVECPATPLPTPP
eukprot:scaffold9627_cov123-Isochrysis_galbana.AAC.8